MNPKEPETIRCPFKAGEAPDILEYPCTVCRIARIRRRKRHWGKHRECTFELDRKKNRKVRAEAAKAVPGKDIKPEKPVPVEEKPKPERAARAKEKAKPEKPPREKKRRRKEPPQPPLPDDYDGYYDDVLPLDHGSARQGLDTAVAQKVVVLIIVVLLIVAACVLVMYFLSINNNRTSISCIHSCKDFH